MGIYEYSQYDDRSSLFPSEKEDETTSTDDTKAIDTIHEAFKEIYHVIPNLQPLISNLLRAKVNFRNKHPSFMKDSYSKLKSFLVGCGIKFPKDEQKLRRFAILLSEVTEKYSPMKSECVSKKIGKEVLEFLNNKNAHLINPNYMEILRKISHSEKPPSSDLKIESLSQDIQLAGKNGNLFSLVPENYHEDYSSSMFPIIDKINMSMLNNRKSVDVHGDHEKNNPLTIVIDSETRKIHDEIKNHTNLVKYYTSVEDYRNAFPDSEKRSHLIIFAHPTTKDELNPLFNMKQVRKVIINCEEKRRTEFESSAKENPLRVVVLRQIDLVVVSTLMNLSKMLKEAANVARETGEKDLALERYELALNLNLESSELLKTHRGKDEDE